MKLYIVTLLDYITNLQEENNSLKQMSKDTYDTSQEIMAELSQEIEEANNSITWWTNRFNAVQRDYKDYKSRIEKANELLQNILVVRDWEHKGKFRPVKNTSKQDVCKTIVMLNELFETPYRTNYGLLQGVGKDE